MSPELQVAGGPASTTWLTEESDPEEERDAARLLAAVLADGQVTDSEMEQALLAAVACVDRAGYQASLDNFSPGRGNELSTHGATSEEATAADAELNRCRELYVGEIEPLYSAQNGPSQEEIEANEARILECLSEMGHPVNGLTVQEAADRVPPSDFGACESG